MRMDHLEMYDYLVMREDALPPGFEYKHMHSAQCCQGDTNLMKDPSSASCNVQDIQNIVFGPA